MIRYIAKRLLMLIPVLLGSVLVVFIMNHISPGNPARMLLGDGATDEPTTALDVTIQAQVLDLIRELKDASGTSMLLITHDLGVVAETCDAVAVIYAGEIVECGSLEDIFDHAAHPYTQCLFATIPSLDKDVEAIYVSPPCLSNLFKDKMDVNLVAYIHKVRIDKAKKLLLESSLSIQKVAELVGYRHEKHFMQIFKKSCGMTPSQFRFRKKE